MQLIKATLAIPALAKRQSCFQDFPAKTEKRAGMILPSLNRVEGEKKWHTL